MASNDLYVIEPLLPSEPVPAKLSEIEGQHTLPADIERALANDYDADPDLARRQRLALAHMRTEAWGKAAWTGRSWRELFSANELGTIHQHLYEQL